MSCRRAVLVLVALLPPAAPAQTFRVSFDASLKADRAAGRAEPWVSRDVELVPGKFGKAARVGPRGQLVYGGEQNVLAGRGTLACWFRATKEPGYDAQRIVFIQAKERGYWNYLATVEWQAWTFRAMVFDFSHGHGLHEQPGAWPFGLNEWHHLVLAWDQAEGVKYYLDGKPAGGTWGQQAWWDRPTPHAIHLSYPGAEYDELCVYDQVLSDAEVAALAGSNKWDVPARSSAWGKAAGNRLTDLFDARDLERGIHMDLGAKRAGPHAIIRQTAVRQVLDDRIPAWRVVDGRMNLFWPEWRAPVLGDVDYSGSELHVTLEKGEKPTHLVLRGLVGGCRVFGEREDFVSREPVARVPDGLHKLANQRLPAGLTGLRVPRREGMKLHELGIYAVDTVPWKPPAGAGVTPLTGLLPADALGPLAAELRTRTLPHERTVLGTASETARRTHPVPAFSRVHVLSEPVTEALPLDAVELRLTLSAPSKELACWLRVQDPVNPRRDLLHVPVYLFTPGLNAEVTLHVVLDFWDVMLDAGSRLWVELLPMSDVHVVTGEGAGHIGLIPGPREKVLREFAHTQSQLAYSYWQLGSEMDGSRGADPKQPSFALLGGITHNRELKLTLEWVRRHVPDDRLVNNLWRIIYERNLTAPVKPKRQPEGAPEWAVWGRELLERFRTMAHHWADRQAPDGQLGGGWNDDTDFPGVFICLPLLGDTKTKRMFLNVYDGLEKTGYLRNGVSRSPIDALHATDFLSWRAHLMLFDYGQPRHVERALRLTRELQKWTALNEKGHRYFLRSHYSEDGPNYVAPRTAVGDSGLIEDTGADRPDGPANRNFLRDPIFCAWYARNPTVLKFVREVAEGDLARAAGGAKLGAYEAYPFFSYFTLFGDRKYLEGPADPFLRDRWSLPIWRRYAERLPNGDRLDKQFAQTAKAKAPSEEQLTAAYLASRDRSLLVRAMRQACERLEGGWQFRGGEAGGANDHFHVPGQAALSQLYLGGALTWLRPASILPPLAVSWEGIDDAVAAHVLEASPKKLRVAVYNFDAQPRYARMRVWELEPGKYQRREGIDADQDDHIDGQPSTRDQSLIRGTPLDLKLPPRQVHVVELHQLEVRPRPELLPDLALGEGDVFYDKATDRLKAVVHNVGAAGAKDVIVRFEDADGRLLGTQVITWLEAPLDLRPKTETVWLSQPTLHPTPWITVRVDPDGRVEEITKENNVGGWVR